MKKIILLVGAVSFVCASNGQITVQKGAGLHLQPKSFVTVQEDVESDDDVTGDGIFVLNGPDLQRLNFHGKHTGGLIIENRNNVQLSSPVAITRRLVLNTGHLICDAHTLKVNELASIEGGSETSFIITSGNGNIRKEISRDLANYFIPVGNSNGYGPLIISSSGMYHHAFIEVSSQNKIHPNKPATRDYLHDFWSVNRKGITGTLHIKAMYKNIEGREEDLKGFYWNGLKWNDRQSHIDIPNRTITVSAGEGKGEIYAFNPTPGIDRDTRMSVFPNPAQSVATVQVSSKYDMEIDLIICDVYGHVVLIKKAMLKTGINRLNINVSGLAKGQYSIKIVGADHDGVISLIKG